LQTFGRDPLLVEVTPIPHRPGQAVDALPEPKLIREEIATSGRLQIEFDWSDPQTAFQVTIRRKE
jgi:hypothetical protein